MRLRIFTMAVLLSTVGTAWAVNKCTAADGTVSFQDAPCPNAAKTQETVRVREQGTISSAGSYGVAHLDLTGTPGQQLVRAAAALETLSDLSVDCKIKLQVYGTKDNTMEACQRFITHHNAWWTPATQVVFEQGKSRSPDVDTRRVERALGFISKVNENGEFILLRMRASR